VHRIITRRRRPKTGRDDLSGMPYLQVTVFNERMYMLGNLFGADPSLIPVDRHPCPKCKKLMVTVQHKEIRQFSCAGCGYVEISLASFPLAMKQLSLDLPDEATALIVAESLAQKRKTCVIVKDFEGVEIYHVEHKLEH
jgi:ribosomal protein S27AE